MDSSIIILICVAVYMVFCVAIGIWAMKRTKSTHDFFMAGRNLGVLITSIAIFSSIMSGFGFVGGPGLVYSMGLSSFWILISTPIGFCIAFYLVAKRLRILAEKTDAISLPEVAEARFDSKTVRLFTSIAVLAGVIAYMAVQIKAMAVVLRDIWNQLCAAHELPWTHEDLLAYVALSSAVLVFYCVTGGIIASVYTDFFQGIIMVTAAVMIFIAAAMSVEGSFSGMSEIMFQDDPESIRPWGTFGIMACLSWHFMFAFGVVGQPHIVTKMMMSKRVEDARGALPLTILGFSLAALLWIGIGMSMRSMVLQGTIADLPKSNSVATTFLQTQVPALLAGIVFAALFAAIMSTADGFLNIGAAAIVHDLPRCFSDKKQPGPRELLMARIATLGLAIASAVFAMYFPDKLLGMLGVFGWGVFAASLAPTIGFGLNWRQASPTAAIASVIVGLAVNVGDIAYKMQGGTLPYGISGGAVALILSSTVFLGLSLWAQEQPMRPEVVEAMKA